MQQWHEDGTRLERTGWRDARISARHREWGFNCPAVDLDFLAIEYNLGLPVALVEYKHYLAREPNLLHPTYRAMKALCDGYSDGPLPFFVAFYWPEIWAFRITPVNEKSKEMCREPGRILTERQFVQGLYTIRRLKIQSSTLVKLNDSLPDEVAA